MRGFAIAALPVPAQGGHRKPSQPGFGLGAAPGSTLIPYLAARAGGGAGKWRDGGRMVMGFHLHQNVLQGLGFDVGLRLPRTLVRRRARRKALYSRTLHHRGVIRIRHQHVLRMRFVRMADHAEHAAVLRLAVNAEVGIENFVATVLAIGLRKHHELYIRRVALQALKGLVQVVDFVLGQCQAKLHIGPFQCRTPPTQHIAIVHGHSGQGLEQTQDLRTLLPNTFGHPVM